MTLWLMMLHHHIKFSNKMFCGSEHIIRTNIHWRIEPSLRLDLECSNPFFFHRTLWLMMLYYQTKFDCKQTSSLEELVIFWLYKPLLWPWHWRQWNQFFCMTFCLMMLHSHTKLGHKMIWGSEDIITDILKDCVFHNWRWSVSNQKTHNKKTGGKKSRNIAVLLRNNVRFLY